MFLEGQIRLVSALLNQAHAREDFGRLLEGGWRARTGRADANA